MATQTVDPTAPGNDPAAWITTGTPTGGGDPKTVEQLATLRRLFADFAAAQPTYSGASVGSAYANQLLLADGSLAPLGVAYFDVQWMQDAFQAQVNARRFLILYWGPKMPTQTVHAVDGTIALEIHTAIVEASEDGRYTGGSSTVNQLQTLAEELAPETVPTGWIPDSGRPPAATDARPSLDDEYLTSEPRLSPTVSPAAVTAPAASSSSSSADSSSSSVPPWWVFAGVGLALIVALRNR